VLITEAPSAAGQCDAPWRWPPFFHHEDALLVLDRNAFVPTLFAKPGMQPIRIADAYRAISIPMLPWAALHAADLEDGRGTLRGPPGEAGVGQARVLDWRRRYDYLLVLQLNCAAGIPVDDRLTLAGSTSAYRLYRIEHGG